MKKICSRGAPVGSSQAHPRVSFGTKGFAFTDSSGCQWKLLISQERKGRKERKKGKERS